MPSILYEEFKLAIVSVSFHGSRESIADGNTDAISFGGSGPGAQSEPDFYYQLTSGTNGSASRRVGTVFGGLAINTFASGTLDMTSASATILLFKVIASNKEALLTNGSPSMLVAIGNDDSNYYAVDTYGSDDYPAKGGFLLFPFNPNVAAYQSNQTGSPGLTTVDFAGVQADFQGTSKVENVAIDAIDIGTGLRLTGGTGTDPSGNFADFVEFDEGDITARYGFASSQGEVANLLGTYWIGRDSTDTTVATEFEAQNEVVTFPDSLVDSGETSIRVDLGNAATTANFTLCTFIGEGTDQFITFNTETDTNSTNDDIANIRSIFREGDAVILNTLSGSESIGVTNNTRYWLGTPSTETDDTTLALFNDRRAALLGSSPVALTPSTVGNGEIFYLRKDPPNRPHFVYDSSSAGRSTINGCNFFSISDFTFNHAVSISASTFLQAKKIVLTGATLYNCNFRDSQIEYGNSLIEASNLEDISNCSFDASNDNAFYHAIELSNTGEFNFVANIFTSFGPAGQTFDTITQVDDVANTITLTGHGFATGDPIIYSENNNGTPDDIGLTADTVVCFINSIDVDTVSLHINEGQAINDNLRISLTDGSAGQQHAIYSAKAAIYNNSGGSVTANILSQGSSPSIRNGPGSSTLVKNTVSLTFTDLVVNSEIRIYDAGTTNELAGVENSGTTFVWAYNPDDVNLVDIVIFNIEYESIRLVNFETANADSSLPVQQQFDRVFDNPD